MKKSIFFFICIIFSVFLFMGQKSDDKPEKWSQPIMTGMYDPSVVSDAPLPQSHDYYNPNSVTRFLKSPNGVNAVTPNFRVLPRANSHQSEVIICRHPLNPLIMFASSNAANNSGSLFISEGVYVTTNGGANWFGSDTLQGSPIGNHGGDPGPTIDKNGTFIMTHLGFSTSGMFANYSTNNGVTWSANFTIVSGSQDKNFAGTDDAPSSPFYGRSYCVWSLFNVASPPIAISYTTNGGVSWSAAAAINTSVAGHYSQGCDIRVGPNGEVYVIWAAPNTSAGNVEDFLGFAKSTNGGVAWAVTNNAYDMNGIRGTFPSKSNIRTNGFPRIDVDRSGGPRNGWIYVVAAERNLAPAGTDPDVVLHKSTNGGTSWSAGVRVNQDALNNGKFQYFPAIRVDESGGVNIVYYDDRNTASDSSEIYLSRSIDGGVTFTDALVSDHRFKPKPLTLSGIAAGYQGDYIGITSGNGKLWPVWMDDFTGIYQTWTTGIDLGPSISHTPLTNTEQIAGSYAVNAVITAAGSPINPSTVRMLWSVNNPSITDSVLMTNPSGDNWTANIPSSGAATYRYYITATDNLGRRSTHPGGAPSNLHTFVASTDNQKPVITHTPIGATPKPNWPVSVDATVTDNLGIDSSWVVWYRNSPATTKQFKLINTSGSSYSALFNSLNSDVNVGDQIFYKIFAQDNSVAHNKDSTALISFQIINQILCEDFTTVTYPPTNWSLDFTGTLYWTRNAVSSFGVGSGSAKFDFWTAGSGVTQSMNTLTFGNTVAGDSLKFDHAYAPYTNGTTDSLEILYSTNAGTTYTRLVQLWGNNTTGNLNTTAQLGSVFTPAANQWASNKVYSLPVGTNKIRFRARSGFGNNLYLDKICIVNNAAAIPVTFSIAPEGFYNTGTTRLNMRDTVRFYLRGINSPYPIVDSGKTVIDSVTLSGTVTFANAGTGQYYIMARHRNTIETWSKSGGESYTKGSPFSYDFTSAITQAFGSNLILKGSEYCIYSGDVNFDYIVDLTDIIATFNDAQTFSSGYIVTDLTGDRFVDLSDITIAYNNAQSFVSRQAPPGAAPSANTKSERPKEVIIEQDNNKVPVTKDVRSGEVKSDVDVRDEKNVISK